MFGGGAESGNAPIQAIVGSTRPVYTVDKGGARSNGEGEGGDRIIGGGVRVRVK